MAKAIKLKKENTPPVPEISEPIEPITELPVVEDIPPSVTLDEVKEVEEIIEPVKEEPNIITEAVVDKVVYPISNPTDDLSMEDKIVQFIDSKTGDIKINDFLKSLFGVPKFNEPPTWVTQGASKQLRVLLTDMQRKGLISIYGDGHSKLGTFYYPDMTTGLTAYHNLNTVPIIAKK